MASRHEECFTMCQDWMNWLDSRRFLGSPEQQNILAKLMAQHKMSKGPPNGPMSADLSAFNSAVMSLDDDYLVPFVVIYCGLKDIPIKTLAFTMQIDRTTFYDRAHKSATDVIRLSKQIKNNRLLAA